MFESITLWRVKSATSVGTSTNQDMGRTLELLVAVHASVPSNLVLDVSYILMMHII